ncbi:MAG: hypothetical protein P9L91_05215 [Candidatus Zophobacter franzmannii]|jgi:hypothetical protein|nr:hypothetical protein [Candidatus Zophobacter franzmannii]
MLNYDSYVVEIPRERALVLIDKAARFFVERRLTPAAIMTIESLKPLNGISSAAMYAVLPVMELFFDSKSYQEFAVLIENREYVSLLVNRIEEIDDELHWEEREKKRAIRIKRRKQFRAWIKNIFNRKQKDIK